VLPLKKKLQTYAGVNNIGVTNGCERIASTARRTTLEQQMNQHLVNNDSYQALKWRKKSSNDPPATSLQYLE
jgi:hypothetical protein